MRLKKKKLKPNIKELVTTKQHIQPSRSNNSQHNTKKKKKVIDFFFGQQKARGRSTRGRDLKKS